MDEQKTEIRTGDKPIQPINTAPQVVAVVAPTVVAPKTGIDLPALTFISTYQYSEFQKLCARNGVSDLRAVYIPTIEEKKRRAIIEQYKGQAEGAQRLIGSFTEAEKKLLLRAS